MTDGGGSLATTLAGIDTGGGSLLIDGRVVGTGSAGTEILNGLLPRVDETIGIIGSTPAALLVGAELEMTDWSGFIAFAGDPVLAAVGILD